jgi:hypothetical protein
MTGFDAEFSRIVEETERIPDPLERWQTRRRLHAELYRAQAAQARDRQAQMSADEQQAAEIEAIVVCAESVAELAEINGQADVVQRAHSIAERGRRALGLDTQRARPHIDRARADRSASTRAPRASRRARDLLGGQRRRRTIRR